MSEKFVELKKENIIFEGKTEKEKKINETIYDLCLENDALYEENKELKQMVLSPDLTITTCPKCGEKYSINYCREVSDLKKENEQLKKHLVTPKNITLKTLENYKSYYDDIEKDNILNDTYIDYCAYLNTLHILTEFEKWLDEEIKRISKLIDPKKSIKPYGEELHLLETARNGYIYAKEELQELKEGKKK